MHKYIEGVEVSVVPVQVDMTNYGHLPFLEKILK